MKTNLTRALILVLLLGSVAMPRLAFAEDSCASDFMSPLERTELKVALKQYEKVLTLRYDAILEAHSTAPEGGVIDKQTEARLLQADQRMKAIETMIEELRSKIRDLTLRADTMAQEARAKKAEN